MSDQQAKKLLEEAADIRRRFASETNSEYRAQLTARYYQIEAELKLLKASAAGTSAEAHSKGEARRMAGSAQPEDSEPFGIRMGIPIGQLGVGVNELGKGAFGLQAVPKPHSFFDHYIVNTSTATLVTAVMAFKIVSPVNRYGSELRSHFQTMVSRLERIYGEPSELIDHLNEDSKWSAPGYWLLGLIEGERTLSAEWDERADIPPNLRRIWLYASSDNNREGDITLRYESIDYEIDLDKYYAEDDDAL